MWYSITMKNTLNDTAVNVVCPFGIVINKVTFYKFLRHFNHLNPNRRCTVLEKINKWEKKC